jgi:hypothetical protein
VTETVPGRDAPRGNLEAVRAVQGSTSVERFDVNQRKPDLVRFLNERAGE